SAKLGMPSFKRFAPTSPLKGVNGGSELSIFLFWSRYSELATSRYPLPWSRAVDLSPSTLGFAPRKIAVRTWIALACGAASRNKAAAPATDGAAKDVPATKYKPPSAPWTKLSYPAEITSTPKRPSAVGPRELK